MAAVTDDVVVHSSSSYIKMSHEPSYKLMLPLTGVTGDAVDSVIGEFALVLLLALFEVKGIITDDGVGGGDRGNTDDEYNGCRLR